MEQVEPTRFARLLKAAATFVVPAAGEGRRPELREPAPHPGGLRTAVLNAHAHDISRPSQIQTEASSLMSVIIKPPGRPAKCCMQLLPARRVGRVYSCRQVTAVAACAPQ